MFYFQYARLLLLAHALAHASNSLALADLDRRDFIKSIYSPGDFDILQTCSKWCLHGWCSDGQGAPGCRDFRPKKGSRDTESFIKSYQCSTSACICDPPSGYFRRTMNDAYKCLTDHCRSKGTTDSAFDIEVGQVQKTIEDYCTSRNITGNFIWTPSIESSAPERSGWKSSDIVTTTFTIFACLVPFMVLGIRYMQLRGWRIRQKRETRGPPLIENPDDSPANSAGASAIPATENQVAANPAAAGYQRADS